MLLLCIGLLETTYRLHIYGRRIYFVTGEIIRLASPTTGFNLGIYLKLSRH